VYEVLIERTAERDLKSLPTNLFDRIVTRIKALAVIPRPSGCHKLAGSKNDWRIWTTGFSPKKYFLRQGPRDRPPYAGWWSCHTHSDPTTSQFHRRTRPERGPARPADLRRPTSRLDGRTSRRCRPALRAALVQAPRQIAPAPGFLIRANE